MPNKDNNQDQDYIITINHSDDGMMLIRCRSKEIALRTVSDFLSEYSDVERFDVEAVGGSAHFVTAITGSILNVGVDMFCVEDMEYNKIY